MTNCHGGVESGKIKLRYIERSGGVIHAPGESLRKFAEAHCQENHGGRDRGFVPVARMGGKMAYWKSGALHINQTAHLVSF